jgi:hypothetical protein
MRLFVSLLIFIFAITNINALSCLSPYLFSISGDDFQLYNPQNIFDNLIVNDDQEYCIIKISINYRKKFFELRSYVDVDSANLTMNREIYFGTHILIPQDETIDGEPDIWNIIEFVCNYPNVCDRTFVLDHLEWLLSTNYNKLALALHLLFPIEDKSEGHFFISNNFE